MHPSKWLLKKSKHWERWLPSMGFLMELLQYKTGGQAKRDDLHYLRPIVIQRKNPSMTAVVWPCLSHSLLPYGALTLKGREHIYIHYRILHAYPGLQEICRALNKLRLC